MSTQAELFDNSKTELTEFVPFIHERDTTGKLLCKNAQPQATNKALNKFKHFFQSSKFSLNQTPKSSQHQQSQKFTRLNPLITSLSYCSHQDEIQLKNTYYNSKKDNPPDKKKDIHKKDFIKKNMSTQYNDQFSKSDNWTR